MRNTHYVNNKKFTNLLSEFIALRKQDDTITLNEFEHGDYIGVCILQICKNLSNKGNFSGYSYKDEMVADGIENCIKACLNFDPEKSKNAFGYFTQVAFNAFRRRIILEKKHVTRKEMFLSDTKSVNDLIASQFKDSGDDNIQFFVDQIHSMLATNDQLHVVKEKVKYKPKKKNKVLSKFL
jgi:hypothetical protein